MEKGFIKYDWFKLFILVLLVGILISSLLQAPTALFFTTPKGDLTGQTSEVKGNDNGEIVTLVDYPEFPITDGLLILDEAVGALVDSDGVLRFQLSEDGNSWVPVVPEQIETKLPEGYQIALDESNVWHITDSNRSVLYKYSLGNMQWVMVEVSKIDSQAGSTSICEGANPTQISSVGAQVKVINALIPLRLTPNAITANIIRALPQGTTLEIIKFSECTTFLEGANLWWGVRTKNGLEGYAAEGSAVSNTYYLHEVE